MRERIKNSNNGAYSLGTNFIADISRGASFVYGKKTADLKIAAVLFRIGDEGRRERIKNSNNRAYSLGTNFIAEISRGASFL